MGIAFLFPGQGSQFVGMGKDLFDRSEDARTAYAEAKQVLGWDVAALCFEGPAEQLNQTEYTQPALLTASIASWRALGAPIDSAGFVAGHSLGEYTALVAAGALSFSDAVRIVHLRGRFMQEAVPEGEGAMAAIVGLKRHHVEKLCREVFSSTGQVSPANYNGPIQTVISGETKAVKRVMTLAIEAGAKRAIQLSVSVPSHSPMMQKACSRLSTELDKVEGADLQKPLINNIAAKIITSWKEAKSGLSDQLSFPLFWEETILLMCEKGIDQFFEVGPGRILSGLLKRIDRGAKVLSVGDTDGLENGLAILKGDPSPGSSPG